ncbi:MAG: hypothetical protein QXK24_06890 [Ignisphaera sp.]
MFEILTHILASICGFFFGIFVIVYRYRDYVRIGFESLLRAWEDGKLDFRDAIYFIVKVYSHVNRVSEQNGALEIINEIKRLFNIGG